MGYIDLRGIPEERLRRARMPPEKEVRAAIRTLQQSPVAGYPPFTEAEVRVIAAYRAALGDLAWDVAWHALCRALPLAWPCAMHEAAEIQSLLEQGIRPLENPAQRPEFLEAHLRATVSELHYLRQWSRQRGYEVSEMALEMTNPIRSAFPGHARRLQQLQARERWATPSVAEEQQARQFWTLVLERGAP